MKPDVKSIVFVEDSEVELLAYRSAMEKAGYCVQWAKDGLAAMRLLHNVAPDVILLDLLLPRFDGVDVMRFLQADATLRNVPVIIFSTNSIIDMDDEPLLEGAAKRVLKAQCTPNLMLKYIQEVLSAHAAKSAAPEQAAAAKPKDDSDSLWKYGEPNTTQRAEAAQVDYDPATTQRAEAAIVR